METKFDKICNDIDRICNELTIKESLLQFADNVEWILRFSKHYNIQIDEDIVYHIILAKNQIRKKAEENKLWK